MDVGVPFTPSAMRSALLHAAGQMTPALGTASEVLALRNAITIVAADIGDSNYDGACRLLAIAYGGLKGMPELPATLPDRDGIRLILVLTAQSLVTVVPQ